MQVSRIQNYNSSFGQWQRDVYKTTKHNSLVQELKHRNDTWFFRDQLEWDYLPKMLDEMFENVPNVNTYFYGCSDGSDAYSFIMTMITQLGEKAKKFLPIKAYDYDKYAINKAKKGSLNITNIEQDKIKYYTKDNINTFLENTHNTYWKPKKILTDNIDFETSNIIKDYKKIKPKNTIIAVRNFWPYLEIKDRYNLARNLYNHMDQNSLLIVGEYDLQEWNGNLNNLLYRVGWEPTYLDCVFKKGVPHPYHEIY